MSPAVVWFRRDLRLSDNPALVRAAAEGEVVPLFVLDPALLEPSGDVRRAFLFGCLDALHDATDGRLVVRTGDPEVVVPKVTQEAGASSVTIAEDFMPYGRARDERVGRKLADAGVELVRSGSPYAVDPGSVRKGDDTPYKVFTPFFRSWLAHGWDRPARRPSGITWANGIRSDKVPRPPTVDADLPTPGEDAAKRRLRAFIGQVTEYAGARNRPDRDGTSRLSPYLRFGCIHPRQILDGLGGGEGAGAFRRELAWREFCADLVFHQPDAARWTLNPKLKDLEVDEGRSADARFEAWRTGRTGFPIVDAGMRQLLHEGWMHNRVRMITASFLVKDLHLPWPRGARWFMEQLVDGDLSSNSQNWQWVAGTAVDPSPFVRVFNPTVQGKKFDPDGAYIRQHVPELRSIGGAAVHEPWKLGPLETSMLDYPQPLVDHSAERAEALARYAAATGN